MSPIYSCSHGGGTGTRESTKSTGQAIQKTSAWMEANGNKSSASLTSYSLSDHGSDNGDFDLNTLFKRLDKYTTEMQEVEDRLRRARSTPRKSEATNTAAVRFSFEEVEAPAKDAISTFPHPPRSSSKKVHQRRPSSEQPPTAKTKVSAPPYVRKSSSPLGIPISRNASLVMRPTKKTDTIVNERNEALAALQMTQAETPRGAFGVFGDWKAWTALHFPPTQPPSLSNRSSSKYSHTIDSFRGSPKHKFVWRESSPAPSLKDTRRTPTFHKASVSDPVPVRKADHPPNYEAYYSEDDEPGPSAPTSMLPPPRSSSKRVVNDLPASPRRSSKTGTNVEAVGGQETTPHRAIPRRRMTTSEGRKSIRNGGFWHDQTIGLFQGHDIPPIPPLSASNSNATLNPSPPFTPLTVADPREDQLRRELEVFSILDGAGALEHRYKERRPPMLNLEDSDNELEDDPTPMPTPLDADHSNALVFSDDDEDDHRNRRPHPRRRKSIFNIFQRRSPVEKLIDMYFDDEPEQKPLHRRLSTWSRKGSPVVEKMPLSPAIPSEFLLQHQHHGRDGTL